MPKAVALFSGGLDSTLAPLGHTHTLPFTADFAFVMGGPATTGQALYTAGPGAWTEIEGSVSYAVSELGTEIILDRAEIGAGGDGVVPARRFLGPGIDQPVLDAVADALAQSGQPEREGRLVELVAALTAFIGMLALNNLPLWYHSLFKSKRFHRVTTDGFFLSVEGG